MSNPADRSSNSTSSPIQTLSDPIVPWKSFAILAAIFVAGGTLLYATRAPRNYQVGLVTWIGYAPILLADDKGYFRDEGLDLGVKFLDAPGEREAAYQSGVIDFFPNTPDAFAILSAETVVDGAIVYALDESSGADGIVAKADIKSVADLKGKRIGFQKAITSHFMLLYALDQAHLKGKDVTQVDLSANDAGVAFMANQLDAAVTWEPYLSVAASSPNSHVLTTSRDMPGLVVDVLLVSNRVLKDDAEAAKKFLRAWNRALATMTSDADASVEIIAKKLKISPDEARRQLKTTRFLTMDESTTYLEHQLPDVMQKATQLFKANDVIRTERKRDINIQAIRP